MMRYSQDHGMYWAHLVNFLTTSQDNGHICGSKANQRKGEALIGFIVEPNIGYHDLCELIFIAVYDLGVGRCQETLMKLLRPNGCIVET